MSKFLAELKICGITQIKQAIEIASMGIHAIGVIGVKQSPRYLSNEKRSNLFKELNESHPKTKRVLVLADPTDANLEEIFSCKGTPSIIQLHGNESKERCEELRKKYSTIKWWKAFRIKSKENIYKIKQYESVVDSILLDAWSENKLGGTGNKIKLSWIQSEDFKLPLWIAGGISAEWVPELLKKIKPFGLDASSKVETSPGIKDINNIKLLIESIRKLD